MPPEKNDHQALHELMIENQRLLTENNDLLRRMNKRLLVSFWLRVVWFLVIVGVPFILYYYILEPYSSSISASFQGLQEGLQESSGWKQFYDSIEASRATGEE